MFIGFWVTFTPQYYMGMEGMPRRVAVYPTHTNLEIWNQVSSAGAALIAVSAAVMLVNIWLSWRHPVMAGDNPWDAHTLEWFTTSPPPHHNYTRLPQIRSERPTWDYNHPDDRTIPHRPKRELVGAGARPSTPPAAGPVEPS